MRTTNNDRLIQQAAEILRGGGVVAYPTDTLYALAVDPRNAAAVAHLFALKERDAGKPSPLIAASLDQAELAVDFNEQGRRLAAEFWPGPLSLLLPANPAVCRAVLAGGSTAAIRVPDHDTARALAFALGYCITATSANVSGQAPACAPADIDVELLARVDLVIEGTCPGGEPSTIVDVTSNPPRLVRSGALAWERVLESLQ